MHAAAHKIHHRKSTLSPRHNSHANSKILAPVKKLNKKVTRYVTKKPYQTAGIVVLLSGVVLGMVYAKLKYLIKD